MTKTRPRQLELPVMVDVNGRPKVGASSDRTAQAVTCVRAVDNGFHKPASADDQSVYKAISDNYFNASTKHV